MSAMWLIKKTIIALVIARVKPVTGLSAASDVTAGVTAFFLASITIRRVFFPLVRLKERQVRGNSLVGYAKPPPNTFKQADRAPSGKDLNRRSITPKSTSKYVAECKGSPAAEILPAIGANEKEDEVEPRRV